jgi:multiple sugar transport system substrate-binding protein
MDKKYIIIGGALLLLIIVAAVLFFMPSGGGKPGGVNPNAQATLTWWKTFEESGNMQELISEYQATHKNVVINFVKKNAADYETELLNAFASGTGPDIFSIHNDWLPKQADKISPMPSSIMSLRTYRDTFVDVAASDFISGNNIYALPLAMDTLALYYNKDILGSVGIAQPPATWPEVVAAVQKISQEGPSGSFTSAGIALGTSNNINRAVDILNLLMLQNGTEFYSSDLTQARFDQSQNNPGSASGSFNPGATALAFYTQFADASKTTYTWNSKSDLSLDAFVQGKVAMMLSYAYIQPMIKSRAPNLNWAVAPVPQVAENSTRINFANYWGDTVSKSSANPAVAWDFLNFLTQKAQLEKYYAKHKQISPRRDMLAQQSQDTEMGPFAEAALTARSVYKKDSNVFEAVFAKMIDDVVLRNFEAAAAVSNAASQITLDLRK